MGASDPFEILLRHDHWATREIIAPCEALSGEQFHRRFEMGPGSLHDTITHIIGAMRVWTDILEQRDIRPRPEGAQKRSPAELRALLDESAAELASIARRRGLEEVVTRVREGKTYTFTRAVVLAHVATHGMHHRAQCLNMLRHVGVNPLPKSSVTEWSLAAEA